MWLPHELLFPPALHRTGFKHDHEYFTALDYEGEDGKKEVSHKRRQAAMHAMDKYEQLYEMLYNINEKAGALPRNGSRVQRAAMKQFSRCAQKSL